MHRTLTAYAIDEALAETFPASDPPAWTAGVARVRPARVLERRTAHDATNSEGDEMRPMDDTGAVHAPGVIDVSRPPSGGAFGPGVLSLAGAAGLAMLVPFVILAIGTPIVFAADILLDVAGAVVSLIL